MTTSDRDDNAPVDASPVVRTGCARSGSLRSLGGVPRRDSLLTIESL
jgi:hypothetical protein